MTLVKLSPAWGPAWSARVSWMAVADFVLTASLSHSFAERMQNTCVQRQAAVLVRGKMYGHLCCFQSVGELQSKLASCHTQVALSTWHGHQVASTKHQAIRT